MLNGACLLALLSLFGRVLLLGLVDRLAHAAVLQARGTLTGIFLHLRQSMTVLVLVWLLQAYISVFCTVQTTCMAVER